MISYHKFGWWRQVIALIYLLVTEGMCVYRDWRCRHISVTASYICLKKKVGKVIDYHAAGQAVGKNVAVGGESQESIVHR